MKKKRVFSTIFLVIITLVLLGTTFYISTLLTSPKSPTQIQKTKAADITYSRKIDLFPTGITEKLSPSISPTVVPSVSKTGAIPPTETPTLSPTIPLPPATIVPLVSPTLQPLLAYKSTAISPTFAPLTNTPSPTPSIKVQQPTGVQQLPETGWIQTSSILFIVATSTILFSLLF